MNSRNCLGLGAAVILAALSTAAQAIPFDSGTTGGVVKVGTAVIPADGYTSLSAAATAFSALSTGINANWTLEIQGNLTEASNSYFGNLTNGFKLTLKPAAATSPVITFTGATGTTSGALVFGSNSGGALVAANVFSTVAGFAINGSNTVSGTTKDLTIQSDPTGTNTNLIRIIGDTDGMTIKNTNILGKRTGAVNESLIGFGNGKTTVNMLVDNFTLQNCLLDVSAANTLATSGIGTNSSVTVFGTVDSGVNMTGHVYTGNTVVARHRGFGTLYIRGYSITNNTITITNPTSGGSSTAIGDLLSNAGTGGTVTITGNKILGLSTVNVAAANGIAGITVGTGGGTTYIINNNTITGFNLSGATPAADTIARGIAGLSGADFYNIEHNSINLAAQPEASGATAGNVGGISLVALTTGTAKINNNIVRTAAAGTNAAAIYIGSAVGTGFAATDIAGNDEFAAAGNVGLIATTPYANFAAWQGAGYDSVASGGQSVDPTTTNPAWNAALHFATRPVIGLGTVTTSTTLTDVDGDTRPATGAIPGADYPTATATAATSWNLYN